VQELTILTTLFVEMVRISQDIRQHIVVQMSNGKGQRGVARELNVGQTTARQIRQRFLDTESTKDSPKCGRPMKSSDRKRRFLSRLLNAKPFSSARECYE